MSFVPKGAMAFEEALERAGVARRVALRQELFAGDCRSGVADPRLGTVDLPAPWWGVEENWTKAVASGSGEYRLYKWVLDRLDGKYQFNRKTGQFELVPAASIIYQGTVFVSTADIDRLFPPPPTKTPAKGRRSQPPSHDKIVKELLDILSTGKKSKEDCKKLVEQRLNCDELAWKSTFLPAWADVPDELKFGPRGKREAAPGAAGAPSPGSERP